MTKRNSSGLRNAGTIATVVDLKQANDIQDDKLVFMCTGSQGEPMAALGRHHRRI